MIQARDLLDSLHWRYACKRFDPTKKISPKDLSALRALCQLAPSSYGLQPWLILHVKDNSVRQQLRMAARNKPQLTDASDLFILCNRKSVEPSEIDEYLQLLCQIRSEKASEQGGYRQFLINRMQEKDSIEQVCWTGKQTYLLLGMLLQASALMGIDSCPMEGFDYQEFSTILDLQAGPWQVACALALGYRHPGDEYQKLPRVRKQLADVIRDI